MIQVLTGLGYGVIALAVVIGIGIVILGTLGKNVASCPTGYAYNTNGTSTFTANTCCLTGGVDCTSAGNQTAASTATQNVNTLTGYLGTSSGGLATWIPIIIVLVIGMMFLGAFLAKKGSRS
jgi:hypothetical protein